MLELSRRGYAKSRHISEAAVRKHIASGLLAPAVLSNGLIDAERADALLADSITRPKVKKVPVVLATARQRRLRAQARDLLDQLDALKRSLVPAKKAMEVVDAQFQVAIDVLKPWPARIAPTVAGKPAAEAVRLLKAGVHDTLQEMQDAPPPPWPSEPEKPSAPDPDALNPVQLAALVENLRAELLELQRLERLGVPRVDYVLGLFEEALGLAKSLLMAIPGRTATLIEVADVAEAERLLAAEVAGVIAQLKIDLTESR